MKKTNKTVVIMQPSYIPWLGYFDLIRQSDYFVFYDDVQFVKQSWQSRNKINSPQGELYLSVPVQKKRHHYDVMIKDVLVDDKQPWRKKHFKSIEQNYRKAPYYRDYIDHLKCIYEQPFEKLADFNINLIKEIAALLEISSKFLRSSDLDLAKGPKEQGIIAICNHLRAKRYLSPVGAIDYLDNEMAKVAFSKERIKVEFQNFQPQVYQQNHKNFTSYLSVFDALLNIGPSATLKNMVESSKEAVPFPQKIPQ
ncbi:WbqC family protein [Alteromonas halophila]|uniref:WbqC family protein n=1 Tax=Alteromonas halophila TaxID=516698 RepID=A0A918JBW0_9ALTE|nr:WbqC family protein [Alteromonas halophila]GGW73500.1 hypothetical protein GCM10007391_01460 [Alteromonas halophila]